MREREGDGYAHPVHVIVKEDPSIRTLGTVSNSRRGTKIEIVSS